MVGLLNALVSGSDRIFIVTIELRFAEEMVTPADKEKKLCPGRKDLVALHIMGVSHLMTIHPSVRKDSVYTTNSHNLLLIFERVTGKNQRTLNRSFSMPDIIVCTSTTRTFTLIAILSLSK